MPTLTASLKAFTFLADILAEARRRPKLTLIILGIAVSLSLIYFSMQRPVYEASASISLGNHGSDARNSLIPPPEQVIASLHERYGPRYHRVDINRPYLSSIDLSRKASAVIYFVAQGQSANEVVVFLNTVVTKEIENLTQRIRTENEVREQTINTLRQNLASSKKELASLREKQHKKDSLSAYTIAGAEANIHQQITNLEFDIYALEAGSRLLIANEPRILLHPMVANEVSAMAPELTRYLMLGVGVGGVLACLLLWFLAKSQVRVHSYQN